MRTSPIRPVLVALALLLLPSGASADARYELNNLAGALATLGQGAEAARLQQAVDSMTAEEMDAVYADADLAPMVARFYEIADAMTELRLRVRATYDEREAAHLESAARAAAAASDVARTPFETADYPSVAICDKHNDTSVSPVRRNDTAAVR